MPLRVAALLAALLTLPGPAADRVDTVAVPAAATSTARSAAEQRQAADYWTAERMRSAALPASAGQPAPWTGGGLIETAVGRVFFTLGGHDFTCSATAVSSANLDTVLTAGHCVNEGPGGFATNWVFAPGYHDGTAPYGTWTARELFAPAGWVRAGELDLDVGFAVLDPRGGRHVADVVGAVAIGFRDLHGAAVDVFGYPLAAPHGGQHLVRCAATTHEDPRGTGNQGVTCQMSQGASGGPWFAGFDPVTGQGTAVSVTSISYADSPETLWGAPFGTAVRSVYDLAQYR